jgi:glycosyltransferase involved in cell wall biosynthesis
VLSQEYPDLEYTVIDGGSTDATLSLLERYEHSLQWISEADHGQPQAINKGLRLATGEVLGFLNAEDIYEAGALRTVGAFFASHPRARWASGDCRMIDPHGAEIRRLVTA